MKVYKVKIAQEIQDAIITRMKAGEFQARDLSEIAAKMLPDIALPLRRSEVAHRVADRIIQRERRTLRTTTYPRWEWCDDRR